VFKSRCRSTDHDGMTVIYAAVAASILMWSGAVVRPAVAQVTTTAPATAGSLAGDWSGALDVQGFQLRLVLHVKSEGGTTTATLDSLDQEAFGIPVSAIARNGETMTFKVDVVGGDYSGAVSADGKTVAGTWSQGGNSLPLVLKRP
jgi:uncharacterized protein